MQVRRVRLHPWLASVLNCTLLFAVNQQVFFPVYYLKLFIRYSMFCLFFDNFKHVYIHCILIISAPTSAVLFPLEPTRIPLFPLDPLSLVSTACTDVVVRPFTRAWATPEDNDSLPLSSHKLPASSSSARVGASWTPTSPYWNVAWLDLLQVTTAVVSSWVEQPHRVENSIS